MKEKKGTGKMAIIAIEVSDSEKEWLQYMAEFYGLSLSELMKQYSMEQLEDAYDQQLAEIAHKQWLEAGKETVSLAEVLAEFGGLE
ncbi:hypothetical protein RV10_GL004375 [Enterococcus pallens]|nr:hypothetical protein RV10_GL004375 [Enterococcus pallens]